MDLSWISDSWRAFLEIALIFLAIYGIVRFLRGSRGMGIMKGLGYFIILAFATLLVLGKLLKLDRINYLLSAFLNTSIFGLIIIFQPELRRALVRLGETPLRGLLDPVKYDTVAELVEAVSRMGRNKVGAIIALERDVGLKGYIEGGQAIDAEVSSQLLESIFFPGTPLHDGAVIISKDRIAGAGCLFPMTENPLVGKNLGTRHRAGVGVTEESDCICLIVSEETGTVSLAHRGQMEREFDREGLDRRIRELFVAEGPTEPVVHPSATHQGHTTRRIRAT